MAKMCTVSRLERQFATLYLFHAPTPPSQPAKWRIYSWISIKRTSNRIANTQPELRTNPPEIVDKQNYEQRGVSEDFRNSAELENPCFSRAPFKG